MFLLCALGLALSIADEPDDADVIVEGHRDLSRAKDAPGAVSVIAVDGRFSQAVDLAEVVASAPGLSVERLGGLGDWSSIRVRGSTPRQVLFLLDGVPLNPDGVGAVDLSEWPVRAFERVEVYRGLLPMRFASAPIGGAVNLVVGRAPRRSVAVGLGQWKTERARALISEPLGASAQVFGAVSAFQTAGDFRYLDDRATVYEPSDDRLIRRQNSDKKQLSMTARLRTGALGFTGSTVLRDQGVGGPMGYRTSAVRYRLAQQLGAVDGSGPVQFSAWGLRREERLSDPLAELGPAPRDTRSLQRDAGLRLTWAHARDTRLSVQVVSQTVFQSRVRLDRAEQHRRLQQHLGVESTLRRLDERAWLRGGLSLLALRGLERPITAILPRLSVGAEPREGWLVKSSAGGGLRPPDFTELYGDQGVLVGRAELEPERALFADLGVSWRRPVGETGRLQLETALFEQRTRDLISYVQNAQRVASPINLGQAQVRGVEAAGLYTAGPWNASASASVLDARDRSTEPAYAGKQLPRVPRFQSAGRVSWTTPAYRIGLSASWKTGGFSDRTNWYAQARRRQLGLQLARRWTNGLSLELSAQNVMNRRSEWVQANPLSPASPARVRVPITDFLGFALPGRTVNLVMSWSLPE